MAYLLGKARLVGHVVVPVDDNEAFREADWEIGNRRVALTEVGDKRVSTVFLTFDHSFGDGPKLWFETMVFPNDSWAEELCERYETWDEAVAGHERIVAELRKQQEEEKAHGR